MHASVEKVKFVGRGKSRKRARMQARKGHGKLERGDVCVCTQSGHVFPMASIVIPLTGSKWLDRGGATPSLQRQCPPQSKIYRFKRFNLVHFVSKTNPGLCLRPWYYGVVGYNFASSQFLAITLNSAPRKLRNR